MEHPYTWLPPVWQWIAAGVLAIVTIVYATHLKAQSQPLTSKIPHGVVELEVPWSSERAQALRDRLTDTELAIAREQVMLDFGFLIVYPILFSLLCAIVAANADGQTAIFGAIVAWAVLLAAPLDAIENAAMLQMLDGRTAAPWPQLSTVCASIKFGLVFGAAGYLLCAVPIVIYRALRS